MTSRTASWNRFQGMAEQILDHEGRRKLCIHKLQDIQFTRLDTTKFLGWKLSKMIIIIFGFVYHLTSFPEMNVTKIAKLSEENDQP